MTECLKRRAGRPYGPDALGKVIGKRSDAGRETTNVSTDSALAVAADSRPNVDKEPGVHESRAPFAEVGHRSFEVAPLRVIYGRAHRRVGEIDALGTVLRRNPLLVAIPAVFVALVFRNLGLFPSVFADEWEYSTSSRLLPFASAQLPDYAYLAIFSFTNRCGEGFLACAQILNAAAFVAASPFIYFASRRVCSGRVSAVVTLLALLGPINTYTAYFMPEALYFLSFWVFCWYVLSLDGSSGRRMWVVAGILLGAAALVKPHALVLLPAILAYATWLGGKERGKGLRSAVGDGGVVIAAVLITKFVGGGLLAGSAGLTLLGPGYTSLAGTALTDSFHARQLIADTARSLLGHLLAICLIFGLPVALLANGLPRTMRSRDAPGARERMSALAILILVDLVVFVALYTAAFSAVGPSGHSTRLHMRYYDFALPLLFIVAGAYLNPGQRSGRSARSFFVALPIGFAIVLAMVSGFGLYTPFLVDSPELRGFITYPKIFITLGCMSLGTLILWAQGSRWATRLFVYGFLPVSVAVTSVVASVELRGRLVQDKVDQAGMFARQYLPHDELSRVLVVGSEPVDLYRALFHLDDPQASLLQVPAGSSFDMAALPAGKRWALIIGSHAWTGGSFSVSPDPDFALVLRDATGDASMDSGSVNRRRWYPRANRVPSAATDEQDRHLPPRGYPTGSVHGSASPTSERLHQTPSPGLTAA